MMEQWEVGFGVERSGIVSKKKPCSEIEATGGGVRIFGCLF